MKRNSIKRYTIVFICIFIINNTLSTYVHAEAVTITALTATEVAVIAGCLVVAGVALQNNEDATLAAYDYFTSTNAEIRNELRELIRDVQGGVLKLNSKIYTTMLDYADTLKGSTKKLMSKFAFHKGNIIGSNVSLVTDSINVFGKNIVLRSTSKLFDKQDDRYRLYIDGICFKGINYNFGEKNINFDYNSIDVEDCVVPRLYMKLAYDNKVHLYVSYIDSKGEHYKKLNDYDTPFYRDVPFPYMKYKYENMCKKPWFDEYWDDKDISIPMPSTLDDVVGHTADEIMEVGSSNPSIPVPNNPPEVEEWSIPQVIITKFPFCIPWDFKKAISNLTKTRKAPKWTIRFDDNYFIGGGKFTIDFAQFEVWAKILRWGELFLFNLFLMLTTRKFISH